MTLGRILSTMIGLAVIALSPMRASAQSCGTCTWYGTAYPLCCTDNGSWSWENNASCASLSMCTAAGQPTSGGSTSGGTTSSCGTCNWYGTTYPTCCTDNGGWGWENSKSCVSKSICPATSSGSTGTSGSCPSSVSCPSGMSCGCYIVSGLGTNKKALTAAGGSLDMMASAMMETEKMDTNYTYGDGKTGDSANFGVCKQNWYMMRLAHPAWRSLTAAQYGTGAAINSSRSLDATVYNESRSYFGSLWWAGHRNGQSGLTTPNTTDINNFKAAWQWTRNNIGSHATDDVRFWVSVPPI
jgi:hypothetical protein